MARQNKMTTRYAIDICADILGVPKERLAKTELLENLVIGLAAQDPNLLAAQRASCSAYDATKKTSWFIKGERLVISFGSNRPPIPFKLLLTFYENYFKDLKTCAIGVNGQYSMTFNAAPFLSHVLPVLAKKEPLPTPHENPQTPDMLYDRTDGEPDEIEENTTEHDLSDAAMRILLINPLIDEQNFCRLAGVTEFNVLDLRMLIQAGLAEPFPWSTEKQTSVTANIGHVCFTLQYDPNNMENIQLGVENRGPSKDGTTITQIMAKLFDYFRNIYPQSILVTEKNQPAYSGTLVESVQFGEQGKRVYISFHRSRYQEILDNLRKIPSPTSQAAPVNSAALFQQPENADTSASAANTSEVKEFTN